ncbi:hypothetical protein [Candidatus Neptunichlamydia sp. REUL1]|uniref:hypothetical protein n=1 Tax=Candidatus Neptunichlamydia sp. REUL1 TaxID=3064277 RepID=UPI00292F5FBF|nr:hypothetical protein [Candidatus Neptunochlamydia sp. REUL1]
MSKEDFRIMIADVPDKEEPVCEVYYKNIGWVQVSAEIPNKFIIAFCNTDEGNYWEFPYDEAMEVLEEAKNHLAKLQRTPEEQARYQARLKEQANWKPTPEETAEYGRKMEEQRKKYYG